MNDHFEFLVQKKLISEDGTQKDEFADAELKSEITNRSNGLINVEFDVKPKSTSKSSGTRKKTASDSSNKKPKKKRKIVTDFVYN